jgi:hypothetical protein
MLRRAPTAITLTQADIEQWEANRQRKIHEAQQKIEAAQSKNTSSNPKEPSSTKQKSKKNRIMGEPDQGH